MYIPCLDSLNMTYRSLLLEFGSAVLTVLLLALSLLQQGLGDKNLFLGGNGTGKLEGQFVYP